MNLGVGDNCNLNGGWTYDCGTSAFVKDSGLLWESLLAGSRTFGIKEIEVFEMTDEMERIVWFT
jgi:hypothetical protein